MFITFSNSQLLCLAPLIAFFTIPIVVTITILAAATANATVSYYFALHLY